jgi:hypothetical protein
VEARADRGRPDHRPLDRLREEILVGSVISGVTGYRSVRFLFPNMENRSLRPLGCYWPGPDMAAS